MRQIHLCCNFIEVTPGMNLALYLELRNTDVFLLLNIPPHRGLLSPKERKGSGKQFSQVFMNAPKVLCSLKDHFIKIICITPAFTHNNAWMDVPHPKARVNCFCMMQGKLHAVVPGEIMLTNKLNCLIMRADEFTQTIQNAVLPEKWLQMDLWWLSASKHQTLSVSVLGTQKLKHSKLVASSENLYLQYLTKAANITQRDLAPNCRLALGYTPLLNISLG